MSSIPPCSGVMQGGTDSAAADASEFFGPTSLTGDNGGGEQASETESAIDRASPRCKGLFVSQLEYRSVYLVDENLEGQPSSYQNFVTLMLLLGRGSSVIIVDKFPYFQEYILIRLFKKCNLNQQGLYCIYLF